MLPITRSLLLNKNNYIKCHNIKKSFTEKGKLILVLEDSQKIIIAGKNIDTSGHKKRICEIVSMAERKEFNIHEKSVKHYARCKGGVEYILVRW